MHKKSMLIVEDHRNLQVALKTVFEDDFDLTFASSGEEALKISEEQKPHVVIMDYKMPGLDGVQTMQLLRDHVPHSQVIIMSALDERQRVIAALRSGAFDFVAKPFDVHEIRALVDQAAAASKKVLKFQNAASAQPANITQREVDDMIDQTLRIACLA